MTETTEEKLEQVDDAVAKFRATETWEFYRCEECDSAGGSPEEIVHTRDCSKRTEEANV